jgi:hypothetical protein
MSCQVLPRCKGKEPKRKSSFCYKFEEIKYRGLGEDLRRGPRP